jgi:hypothetical protein
MNDTDKVKYAFIFLIEVLNSKNMKAMHTDNLRYEGKIYRLSIEEVTSENTDKSSSGVKTPRAGDSEV